MTEWYEKAYLGGGPVKVNGFPRPMYPPDATKKGKQPSPPGPDVIAYKRALCRAGRWGDWKPESWDDAYSNNFAHGKGGNVKDTGVRGFQRQMDIDDTGWLGKKTFDAMRYALISDPSSPNYKQPIFDSVCVSNLNKAYSMFKGSNPPPSGSGTLRQAALDLAISDPSSPNYKQPIFDSVCVSNLNKAYSMFKGSNPPPSGSGTLRQAALDLAISQIGVKESPANTNQVKYTSWYGMVGPWCAMFVTWCFETNKRGQSPTFVKGSRYAYVPYVVSDARAKRNGLVTTDDPMPGDLVCYDWNWDSEYDHIGIFERWTSGTTQFSAIEGNTSTSDNSNGGQVMRRTRSKSGQGTVFCRVKEPA